GDSQFKIGIKIVLPSRGIAQVEKHGDGRNWANYSADGQHYVQCVEQLRTRGSRGSFNHSRGGSLELMLQVLKAVWLILVDIKGPRFGVAVLLLCHRLIVLPSTIGFHTSSTSGV